MWYQKLIVASLVFYLSCASQKPEVVPDYDFSRINTISVQEINDFPNADGSGEIVFSALYDLLIDKGVNIVEKKDSPNATLLCSISDFNNQRTAFIPVELIDRGDALSGIDKAYAETDATQSTTLTSDEQKNTHLKETMTRTKEIKFNDVAVGIKLQLLDINKGKVIWSSDYTYSALNQKDALKKCVTGALSTLIKTLKK